jgi:hypothetical protein
MSHWILRNFWSCSAALTVFALSLFLLPWLYFGGGLGTLNLNLIVALLVGSALLPSGLLSIFLSDREFQNEFVQEPSPIDD